MEPFIHLHVHTQYSLLDGQASIDALIDKAQKDGMPAIAVTDHGVMFGIKEFFNKLSKKNGKPLGAIKDYEKELKELKNRTELTADELEAAGRQARELIAAGVDALIVQDMALRRMNLPVELHASTQMCNMTPAQARFLASAGSPG